MGRVERRRFGPLHLLPALVLVVGTVASLTAGARVEGVQARRERARFEQVVDRVGRSFDGELARYEDLLVATSGLLANDPALDGPAFERYVTGLDLEARYPAVNAFVFAVGRADGVGFDVAVAQPPEILDVVRGIDLGTVPELAEVVDQGRQRGGAALTARLRAFEGLPGTADGPLFALVIPVPLPAPGAIPAEAPIGWLAIGFSAASFASSLSEDVLDVAVILRASGEAIGSDVVPEASLRSTRPVAAYGGDWSVEVAALPSFSGGQVARERVLVSAGGTFAAALLAALLLSFQRSRRRDRDLLDALEVSGARLRTLVDASPQAILEVDEHGRVRSWNRAADDLFGWPPSGGGAPPPGAASLPLPSLLRRVGGGARAELDTSYRRADGSGVQVALSAAPLRREDGRVAGAIVVAGDITARKELEVELEHNALHDALTGLPNRALLLDRLEHALTAARRDGSAVAVLFLDLDRFKVINDSLGHAAGDELLVEVARRLRSCARASDTVARLGGDEFVVCCERVAEDGDGDVDDVARRVAAAVARPIVLRGVEVVVTTSLGIAVGASGVEADALLGDADAALYRAKERGRDRIEVFDDDLAASVASRIAVESQLNRAIERGELRLHYQPVVDLVTGEVPQVEALVRWQHPERGLLPPSEFIPVAEESGIIVALGEWTLREACRWRASQPEGDRPAVSVNVAARQLATGDLVDLVVRVLAETGTPAPALNLEVTETVLIEDHELARARLAELRALGVSVAIDDFGTGYSSLAYLRRFPISTVKLDRSFVSGLGSDPVDAVIVGAVVDLAHALEMLVVAEGVEDVAQLDALRALGCDRAQGYLLARPTPPDQLRLHGLLEGLPGPGVLLGRR